MVNDFLSEETLISWLQRFVQYPSQQTELQESDPCVRAFIEECVAPLLKNLGFQYHFDSMKNLIMEAGSGTDEGGLLFMTYAMTHPAANMDDPFSAKIIETEHGKAVRGRGVAEQKTALTAAIAAVAQALSEGAPTGRLIFTLSTAGETGRHDAAQSIMAELKSPPKFAVVCIGTDNKVAIGNKGRIDFDVIVKGKTSHSSTPWNGINAINGAWRLLQMLEDFDIGVADHPTFGPATLTPTALSSSPKATHTVQDRVRLTFDRRVLPGENPHRCFDAIKQVIALDKPWDTEVELGPVMYPNEITLDGPFMTLIDEAYRQTDIGSANPFHCNFALDGGYFAQQGIEAVMMGPGEVDQFHSNEESVLVSDLVNMANIYYRLIKLSVPFSEN